MVARPCDGPVVCGRIGVVAWDTEIARGPVQQSGRSAAAWWRTRLGWDRYHWWHEVVIIAVGYAIYTVIRDTVPAQRSIALANAHQIVHLEQRLGMYHERVLNAAIAPIPWLADICDYWYATTHFALTIGVGVWIIWRHPRLSRSLRITWYSMNLFALVGFAFYPLAPPRFLPSFVDTIMKYGIWGSVGKAANADGASNQFASMPSMHMGWATWSGVVIVVVASRWWVKALGVAYPLITFLVVLGTGNHYVLDVAGGLVALLLGFVTSVVITRHGPFEPEPERSPPVCSPTPG